MIRSTLGLSDLQVQPNCRSCEHADCPPSQGGSGLSFTLFLGYGGNNHWALRRTKPPSHSRHVALLVWSYYVISKVSARVYKQRALSAIRSAQFTLCDWISKRHHHGFKASRVPASIYWTTNSASRSCNRCTGKYMHVSEIFFLLRQRPVSISPCTLLYMYTYRIGYREVYMSYYSGKKKLRSLQCCR